MRLWRMADGSSGTDSLARSGNAQWRWSRRLTAGGRVSRQAGVSGGPRCQ